MESTFFAIINHSISQIELLGGDEFHLSDRSGESEMQYIRVRWNHDRSDEPVELWSELDGESWEVRKVEVFPDGHLGFASRDESD